MPKHITDNEMKLLVVDIKNDPEIFFSYQYKKSDFLEELQKIEYNFFHTSLKRVTSIEECLPDQDDREYCFEEIGNLLCKYFGGFVGSIYQLEENYNREIKPTIINIHWDNKVPEDGGIWKRVNTDQTIREWRANDMGSEEDLTDDSRNYDFTCPQCNCHVIEEIVTNVIQNSPVKRLATDENGQKTVTEYDQKNVTVEANDFSDVMYQCANCGLEVNINDECVITEG